MIPRQYNCIIYIVLSYVSNDFVHDVIMVIFLVSDKFLE